LQQRTTGKKTIEAQGRRVTPNGVYRAYIRVDRKRIHLGSYATPEEAARAYDVAALIYHGSFSYLNYPQLRDEYLTEIQASTVVGKGAA
jgi:AP2 domain